MIGYLKDVFKFAFSSQCGYLGYMICILIGLLIVTSIIKSNNISIVFIQKNFAMIGGIVGAITLALFLTMGPLFKHMDLSSKTTKTATDKEEVTEMRKINTIIANWKDGEVQLTSEVALYNKTDVKEDGWDPNWVDHTEVKPGDELFIKVKLTNTSSKTIKNPYIKVSLPDNKYGLEYVPDYARITYINSKGKKDIVGLNDSIVRQGSTSPDIQSHNFVYISYKLKVTKAPAGLYSEMKPEIVIWNEDGMVIADNSVTIHLVDPKGDKNDHKRVAVIGNSAGITAEGPGTDNDNGGFGGSVVSTTGDQNWKNQDRGLKQATASINEKAPPMENGAIDLPYGAVRNQ